MREIDIRRIPRKPQNFHPQKESFRPVEISPVQYVEQPIVSAPIAQKPRNLYKLVLLPFTVIVLILGTLLGARFVNFAKSVSVSKESFYKNIFALPGLDILNQSDISNAIAEGKKLNILFLGYGGGAHDGKFLTDTMMLGSFDFSKNTVSLVSVPRDLWIEIPTRGYDGYSGKINSAYSVGLDQKNYPYKLPQFSGPEGGGNMSKYVVSQAFGIPVDYFVSIDFEGFKNVVDTLGGVQINVENSFTDYMFPSSQKNADGPICSASGPNAETSACRYRQLHFDKGLQYMDGERALEYVRSRHALGPEGSDFARSKRQQNLIAAIQEKALSWNVASKIFELLDDIQGHFQTDLSIAEIKDLVDYAKNIDLSSAKRVSITDGSLLVGSTLEDGQWVLMPSSGIDDFREVRDYIRTELGY